MMSAYGKRGSTPEMMNLFDEMIAARIPANDATYNCIIDAFGRAGDFEVTSSLYKTRKNLKIQPLLQ